MAITDKYNAAGKTPWAMGGRDGWTLTDWFENIYVRVAGPEKYHQLFVTHELEWTDASVVEAMGYFRQIVDPDTRIMGGAEGAISTGFIEGMDAMLQDKAEMYYEGGFMGGIAKANFPDLTCGEDYAWFTFPSIKPEYGKGIVVGGDFAVVFNVAIKTVSKIKSKPIVAQKLLRIFGIDDVEAEAVDDTRFDHQWSGN